MNHSFDVEIAKKYGIEEAILLQNLYFWIEKNKANNKHYYNDTYWTYNSKKAFADIFPYMTPRKIDYTLKNLIDKGLVITGNFNENATDRTLWYALTKMGYCILQNCEMEQTKLSNDIDTTINNNTNINNKCNNINLDNNNYNDLKEKYKKENDFQSILDYWNTKKIIVHRKPTVDMKNAYKKIIKNYNLTDEEIKLAIDHYEQALHSDYEYCDYEWSLYQFLSNKKGIIEFLDDGSKWVNYCKYKSKPKTVMQVNELPAEELPDGYMFNDNNF